MLPHLLPHHTFYTTAKTETSSVVPKGYYQLETGYQYQKQRQNGVEEKEWEYPQALFRIGISEKAELRLEGTYRRQDTRVGDVLAQQNKGLSTVRVGSKVNFLQENGVLPEVSLIGMVELPWGADSFEPEKVAPELRFLFTHTLSPKLTFQYNLGYRRQKEDGNMENKLQYTAALSSKLNDKVAVFAEFFGDKVKGQHPQHQVDGGIQLMLLPNLQFDAVAGLGISAEAPEMFLGTGLSLRLPQ